MYCMKLNWKIKCKGSNGIQTRPSASLGCRGSSSLAILIERVRLLPLHEDLHVTQPLDHPSIEGPPIV